MNSRTKLNQLLGFIGWMLVAYITATAGAIASINAASFYAAINQPSWAPPGWVFGPVWTTLYTLMGISAWLVWRSDGFRQSRLSLVVFLAQLFFNALWSWLFFDWHLGAWAFVDVIWLLLLIATNIVLFWRVKPIAATLLLPYFFWVMFAAVLNYAVWQLNPAVLG